MNRVSIIHYPKPVGRHFARTLLLALPLSGIAFQLSPVQAQPATPLPAKKNPHPLSPEQKANVLALLEISRQERALKKVVDFKVENATLEQVIARLRPMSLGETLAIEVRGAAPVKVSFDLKGAKVGNVLDGVAALAGCRLFLRGAGLLIAPVSQLTAAEINDIKTQVGGEWSKNTSSGGEGWSSTNRTSELFTRLVAQEATGSNAKNLPAVTVNTTFNSFSPDSQAIITELANWATAGAMQFRPNIPLPILNSTSTIIVDTTQPGSISVRFPPDSSNPGGRGIGVSSTVINIPDLEPKG